MSNERKMTIDGVELRDGDTLKWSSIEEALEECASYNELLSNEAVPKSEPCRSCGGETEFSGHTLDSYPAYWAVHCLKCNWTGYQQEPEDWRRIPNEP